MRRMWLRISGRRTYPFVAVTDRDMKLPTMEQLEAAVDAVPHPLSPQDSIRVQRLLAVLRYLDARAYFNQRGQSGS